MLAQCVWLFATPWTVARQAPLCVGLCRQECCSGLPFFSRGLECTEAVVCGVNDHLPLPPLLPPTALASHSNYPACSQ